MDGLNLALATFDFGVSTGEAFCWWDEDGGSTGPDPAEILREADPGVIGRRGQDPNHFAELLYNDLEESVVRRHPIIGDVKDRLMAAGAVAAVMSGSGPSLVAVLPWQRRRLDREVEVDVERISGRSLLYVTSEPFLP
jgi:4-diphosphocytidyl-2-C-methyl-D-erythritol kinase